MNLERLTLLGRPRRLGEAQIARILEWHRNRLTLKDLARELNVSAGTVRNVILAQGEGYKQPPPELRAAAREAVRRRRARLEQEGLA
jgi:transposase